MALVVFLLVVTSGDLVSAPDWLRVGFGVASVGAAWAAVRFTNRMRHGHHGAVLGTLAACGVLVVLLAGAAAGADAFGPVAFTQGVLQSVGERLIATSEIPRGLAIFVVGPLALALNASALGHVLRRRRVLGSRAVRWPILTVAALLSFELAAQLVADAHAAGSSAQVIAAPVVVVFVMLALRGAAEIHRWRHGETPAAWETPTPDRGRRLFTGRQPVRVAALLLAALLCGLVAFMLRWTPLPETADTVQEIFIHLLQTESARLGLLVVAVALYLRARRHAALRAAELRARDPRRPVLLLRSFEDDRLRVWSHRSPRQALIERMLGRRRERFEVVLGWHLWAVGPLTAVGVPTERLPPLGAAREYLADERWQEEVACRIADAQSIVLILGRSEGLLWELRAIERLGARAKTMIVVPPLDGHELRRRWTQFAAVAAQLGWPMPAEDARTSMLAGCLDGDRRWTIFSGRRRDEYGYEVALEAGQAHLSREPEQPGAAQADADPAT